MGDATLPLSPCCIEQAKETLDKVSDWRQRNSRDNQVQYNQTDEGHAVFAPINAGWPANQKHSDQRLKFLYSICKIQQFQKFDKFNFLSHGTAPCTPPPRHILYITVITSLFICQARINWFRKVFHYQESFISISALFWRESEVSSDVVAQKKNGIAGWCTKILFWNGTDLSRRKAAI